MSLFGSIGGALGGLFGGGDSGDPSAAAQQYLSQIPGMEKQYLDPFIQRGAGAHDVFGPVAQRMTQDPAGYLESIMKGYEPSRGYQLKRDEALRAAAATAAAGGMRGSPQDIAQQTDLSARLQGEDMQQWLQNVLGLQQRGMGTEQGLYQTGFGAATGLAGDLANVLGQQAQYAFQGERERMQQEADRRSGLGGLLGEAGGLVGGALGWL